MLLPLCARATAAFQYAPGGVDPAAQQANRPRFVSWVVTTTDAKIHTGVIWDEGPNSTITLADAQGKR